MKASKIPLGYVTAYDVDGKKKLFTFKQLERCIIHLTQYNTFETLAEVKAREKYYRYNMNVRAKWIKEDGVLQADLRTAE